MFNWCSELTIAAFQNYLHGHMHLKLYCCFQVLWVLSISEGPFIPDYLEFITTVLVTMWTRLNISSYIDIVFFVCFFFQILVIQCSKQTTSKKLVLGDKSC